jgi:NTP pyrophosphatase (non-canonical NTP hydrolase)
LRVGVDDADGLVAFSPRANRRTHRFRDNTCAKSGRREVAMANEVERAVATLTERAQTTRAGFAAYERATVGHEWGPAELMAGFVADVGDLSRLVMATQGHRLIDDHQPKLEHELADCLWSVLVLADALDVDLGAAFLRTLDELAASLRQ